MRKPQRRGLKRPAQPAEAEEALEAIDAILKRITEIEEDYPESWERGEDFLTDVREKLSDIRPRVVEYGSATAKQMQAIRNWGDGVDRWHPEYRD